MPPAPISPEIEAEAEQLRPLKAPEGGAPIRSRVLFLGLALLVGAILLSACGGGSSSSPGTGSGGRASGGSEGWGGNGTFIGRYHLEILSAGPSGVHGGELTMFIQEEFPGSEEPAGILKLRTKTNNDVVYLKELRQKGSDRTAVVKGGSFLGPTIGNFTGTMIKAGKIKATISTRGLGKVKAVFTRYSKEPAP